MAHCITCEYLDQDNGHFRCIYTQKQKKEEKITMKENQMKELTYHFSRKNGITYSDLETIKHQHHELKAVQVTQLSQFHVRLEHTDDFVLCRFLDQMQEIERKKIIG